MSWTSNGQNSLCLRCRVRLGRHKEEMRFDRVCCRLFPSRENVEDCFIFCFPSNHFCENCICFLSFDRQKLNLLFSSGQVSSIEIFQYLKGKQSFLLLLLLFISLFYTINVTQLLSYRVINVFRNLIYVFVFLQVLLKHHLNLNIILKVFNQSEITLCTFLNVTSCSQQLWLQWYKVKVTFG